MEDIIKEKVTSKEKTPKKVKNKNFKVVIYNDDVTPFEYVITVLLMIFGKELKEAFDLALYVHNNGKGVAGFYSEEEAYEKIDELDECNKEVGYDLYATVEE